ncbi:MAG: hypothetical protein ABIN57_09690 [Chitinophagaceae bacterium]
MKDHEKAQAILHSTGHPLEPLVAFEVNKMYHQNKLVSFINLPSPFSEFRGTTFLLSGEHGGVDWYNNYE